MTLLKETRRRKTQMTDFSYVEKLQLTPENDKSNFSEIFENSCLTLPPYCIVCIVYNKFKDSANQNFEGAL